MQTTAILDDNFTGH